MVDRSTRGDTFPLTFIRPVVKLRLLGLTFSDVFAHKNQSKCTDAIVWHSFSLALFLLGKVFAVVVEVGGKPLVLDIIIN